MNNTKILSTLFSTLFISSLTLTANAAPIEKVALIKAEKISYAALISDAQINLQHSFSNIKLNTVTIAINADKVIALQKIDMNKNEPVTISKITLVTE